MTAATILSVLEGLCLLLCSPEHMGPPPSAPHTARVTPPPLQPQRGLPLFASRLLCREGLPPLQPGTRVCVLATSEPHLNTLHIDARTHKLPPDQVGPAVPAGNGVHDFSLQALLLFSHLHFSQGASTGKGERQNQLQPLQSTSCKSTTAATQTPDIKVRGGLRQAQVGSDITHQSLQG